MKVFAQYFESEDGLYYRKNTLLQFGSGSELIGSCVLANPGSARPLNVVSEIERSFITDFTQQWKNESAQAPQSNWFVFSADSTMKQIEKIFNGFYLGKEPEKLNGIVQLFNTFNVVNQNLAEAIKQSEQEHEHLFSVDANKFFQDKPVYFGFSQEVLCNPRLRSVAKDIFNKTSDRLKKPYDGCFEKNKFYHPGYVNRAYKQQHFQGYKEQVLTNMYSSLT